jgi:hypothetical protein
VYELKAVEVTRKKINMAMDPPATADDNLVDHSDSGSQPSQHSGDNSNTSKDDSARNTIDSDRGVTSQVATISEDEREPSISSEAKQGEGKVSDTAKVQVSRQTLSEYQAAKQKTKQERMVASMANQTTLEEDVLVEPNGMSRSSSWQPAHSQGQKHADAYKSVPNLPTEPNEQQKAKQLRMVAAMADQSTLEEEDEFYEPTDMSRSASWQPASSQAQRNSDAQKSVPNLPTESVKNSYKTTAKRVPSSGSYSPKTLRMNRVRAKDMLSKSEHRPTRHQYDGGSNDYARLRQQNPLSKSEHRSTRHQNDEGTKDHVRLRQQTALSKSEHPPTRHKSEEDVNKSYQRLRQQTASRPNRAANTPMSGEDVKMGYATLLSRNHTTGAMPPTRSMGTASDVTMDFDDTSSDDDDLTLLRDDSSSDEEGARRMPRPLPPLGNNNSFQTPSGRFDDSAVKAQYSRMGIAAQSAQGFDDSAVKAQYSRMGIAARPTQGGGGALPSRSEHGTNSTRMNSKRPASSHPIIDDDPRVSAYELEAELIRKSLSATNDDSQQAAQEDDPNAPWPSALAYDPSVPGAHGIHAPGSQETPTDRREGFERYDSYLTNRDRYLVSATLVDEDESGGGRPGLNKERSERFRLLESRQAELEDQIEQQKKLIEAHHEELSRLKNSQEGIVQAEVVGEADKTLGRFIRQRESIIAEKEEELNTLMGRPIPGMGLLRKYDQRKEKKKKQGKLINKLNPFRKTTETIQELDESSHSGVSSTSNSKKPSSESNRLFSKTSSVEGEEEGDSASFNEDMDTSSRDATENELPSRETLLLETKKRSERFIAPEKLPFEDNTISELKQIAQESDVDISGCVERSQIVKTLQDAGVKPKKKGALNKFFAKTKSPKNSMNKSSSHSLNMSTHSTKKTPKTENKRVVDIPPADMPAPMVMEKRESVYAPKQTDVFEGISISQLKKIARERDVDVSTCTDRNDLVTVLYAAGMRPPGQGEPPKDPLNDLNVTTLKKLARENNVDISSCVEKGQIISALNVAGVRPPKKGSSTSKDNGGASWDKMSISELKKVARKGNVDVSTCVEKKEIITKLRRAGVGPLSPSNMKKAAPRLSRSELSEWRPTQLQILAIHIGATSSGDLLANILQVANEEKKKLRAPIRSIASLGPAPLGKLRNFAKDQRVDISGCVEKDEMLKRILQKYIR